MKLQIPGQLRQIVPIHTVVAAILTQTISKPFIKFDLQIAQRQTGRASIILQYKYFPRTRIAICAKSSTGTYRYGTRTVRL